MKKTAVFILALFYLCVTTGATVHLDYCMGKLIGKGLLHDSSKKCSNCGMEKDEDNGCCKEELKQLKIDNDQNIPESGLQILPIFPLIFFIIETPATNLSSVTGRVSQCHAPPLKSNIAVYKRNCVFLI